MNYSYYDPSVTGFQPQAPYPYATYIAPAPTVVVPAPVVETKKPADEPVGFVDLVNHMQHTTNYR
jgi:hypothetical protein